MKSLIAKYDVQVPRYTSYPTVPFWSKTPTRDEWLEDVVKTMTPTDATWSMYLHIPFCETLCTFCGCNTIITKDHKQEGSYVNLILKEWEFYQKNASLLMKRTLQDVHLGGGTPTFLSPENLRHLMTEIFKSVSVDQKNFEASIEVDPRRTSFEQLDTLKEIGFNRISLGVQDFNHRVQELINRVQPYDITKNLTEYARKIGYDSVNFDLIYGLPVQDLALIKTTVEKTIELRPDRIALYSFALVPWIKPAQRLFKDSDLPSAEVKRDLYELSRAMLLEAGYIDIGMDHFALPTDHLAKAYQTKKLHRNFMGYTDQKSDLLLGLGVSSISESRAIFHQNEKVLPKYIEHVNAGSLATIRGHILTERDQLMRKKILRLMTTYEVTLDNELEQKDIETSLAALIADGLVEVEPHLLKITEKGKPFLRNVCAVFDDYIRSKTPTEKLFSKSI